MKNPFVPYAGVSPPELAGRDGLLQDVRTACLRALHGKVPGAFMLTGLRGTGKTVLLDRMAREAEAQGCIVSLAEASGDASLARLLISQAEFGSFAGRFERPIDGASLERDLADLFELIGTAAQEQKTVRVLLIDEVHRLKKPDLSALIAVMHRTAQRGLPVLLVGAGLPHMTRLAGEAKPYAERLFDWRTIGPLPPDAVKTAVRVPAERAGARITEEALEAIAEITQGHPLFVQLIAHHAWGPSIALEDVLRAREAAFSSLFGAMMQRLTATEVRFVRALAQASGPSYRARDAAERLKRTTKTCSRVRASLIRKEILFSPHRGRLAFTLPLFAQHLNEIHGEDAP